MQLSNRLQAVANLVEAGGRVADIGCDHAYTSMYLMEHGLAEHVIAMDVNKGPLEKAKANVKAYGYEEAIETRLSDGAAKLEVGEVDGILISGMGGVLMVRILKDRMDVLKSLKQLVLQPQSEIHLVREFLHEQGFRITKEIFLKEDGKYYVAMHAVPGEEKYESKTFYYYSKYLLEEKHEVLREFLLREKQMREEIRQALQSKVTEKSQSRIEELNEELAVIADALSYFES